MSVFFVFWFFLLNFNRYFFTHYFSLCCLYKLVFLPKCFLLHYNLASRLILNPFHVNVLFLYPLDTPRLSVILTRNPIQNGHFRGCSRMEWGGGERGGQKGSSPYNPSHICYNNETWQGYTLPKEDPESI